MGNDQYSQSYRGKRFVECSREVGTCFYYIDIAIVDWQQKHQIAPTQSTHGLHS